MTLQSLFAQLARVPALLSEVETLRADLTQLRAEFDTEKQMITDFLAQVDAVPVGVPPVVVPPVSSGDPNDPALFVMPAGANLDDAAVRDGLIRHASRICNHVEATDSQLAYWREVWPGLVARGVELHMPDYVWKKLIGWQATGADKPTYGPFR